MRLSPFKNAHTLHDFTNMSEVTLSDHLSHEGEGRFMRTVLAEGGSGSSWSRGWRIESCRGSVLPSIAGGRLGPDEEMCSPDSESGLSSPSLVRTRFDGDCGNREPICQRRERVRLFISGFQVRVLVGALSEPLPCEGVRCFCAVKLSPRAPSNPVPFFTLLVNNLVNTFWSLSYVLPQRDGIPPTGQLGSVGMPSLHEEC
jgi:hypothetical protein